MVWVFIIKIIIFISLICLKRIVKYKINEVNKSRDKKIQYYDDNSYFRYTLLGIVMLFLSYFGIKVIEQTIDDFNDLTTPINLFIVISVDYIWYKYISKYGKKEMETFMFIEDFYKILYFMFGLLIASIFSSGDSFFFAILCIILEIIVILALILYFLNNYSKADKDKKSHFFTALLSVALMLLFVEKFEFKSIRIYKDIIEILLSSIIIMIFSSTSKKNRNIKNNSQKWIKIKK